jgi:adenosylhomocysteine nucleosidase
MQSEAVAPGSRTPSAGDKVAIIAALASERRTLATVEVPGMAATIFVIQSGPGADAANRSALYAVANGATALISWGLAGGLNPAAVPGTLILPKRVVAPGLATLETTGQWRSRLESLCPSDLSVNSGDLATVPRVLLTPAEKALAEIELSAVAADMESWAIGDVARRAGLPFAVVRVIVDGPEDALPEQISSFVTAAGETRPVAAALSVLWHPGNFSLVMNLARRSALAHRVLAAFARQLRNNAFVPELTSLNAPRPGGYA